MSKCPQEDCTGTLESKREESCSCHIHPPCSACVDAPLVCVKCGHVEEVIQMNGDRCVVENEIVKAWRHRALDPTKIDWRSLSHTHFTMIKEGVYPEGTTQAEVLEKVKGPFGGRFEYFGNGRFKYIAYTD